MRFASLIALALPTSCKPPPELVARDADLSRRIAELEELIAAEDSHREKSEQLEAELARFEIDKAAVKEVAGPAKVSISRLDVTLTVPGQPRAGVELVARLLARQPELRLSTFAFDRREVTIDAIARPCSSTTSPASPARPAPRSSSRSRSA